VIYLINRKQSSEISIAKYLTKIAPTVLYSGFVFGAGHFLATVLIKKYLNYLFKYAALPSYK
jgi:hypothetical protein